MYLGRVGSQFYDKTEEESQQSETSYNTTRTGDRAYIPDRDDVARSDEPRTRNREDGSEDGSQQMPSVPADHSGSGGDDGSSSDPKNGSDDGSDEKSNGDGDKMPDNKATSEADKSALLSWSENPYLIAGIGAAAFFIMVKAMESGNK